MKKEMIFDNPILKMQSWYTEWVVEGVVYGFIYHIFY